MRSLTFCELILQQAADVDLGPEEEAGVDA